MANMITKRYKIGAFYEFLQIRKTLWKLQFTCLIIALVLGFPTTVLEKLRATLAYADAQSVAQGGDAEHAADVELLDSILYKVFIAGIYKDHRKDVQNYFYVPMLAILFGLCIEK